MSQQKYKTGHGVIQYQQPTQVQVLKRPTLNKSPQKTANIKILRTWDKVIGLLQRHK